MIGREEAAALRVQLLELLQEDAHNTERLVKRLDELTWESGISAHAALLLILTRLPFDDAEARRHWEAILRHREETSGAMGRDVGLRVAILDYFVNVNRRLKRPAIIDLKFLDEAGRASGIDTLTGLADERAFRGAVQAELRRAKRYGQAVAVAVFDLDDFRIVRDQVGGLVADRLLRETAMVMSNAVRDIDFAARPGEDEFSILLPQTDRYGGYLVAERCRAAIEAHFTRREVGGRSLDLRATGGVASYPLDARAPDDLLARAAQALYEAKASGKNTVRTHTAERRRYIRFDVPPDRCEVEVVAPRPLPHVVMPNLGPGGLLLESPEPLEVGETVILRVNGGGAGTLRMLGRVVRVEEMPPRQDPTDGPNPEGFEIGIAFLAAEGDAERTILEFLERMNARGKAGKAP